MSLEDDLRAQGIEVHGTFDTQRFFDTLAMILSRKYNMKLTFRVLDEYSDTKQAS